MCAIPQALLKATKLGTWMSKLKITHVRSVDPEAEWRGGLFGFWTRISGLLTWTLANFGLGWLALFYERWELTVVVAGWLVAGVAVLFLLRRYRIQRMLINHHFHDFAHNIRDEAAKVTGSGKNPEGGVARFEAFSHNAAEYIARAFREILGDPSLACTIRLASLGEDGRKEYITCGRSKGLDPTREENSEAIPADKGLPAKLRSANHQGVFIIPSIKEAIASGDYYETENDSLNDSESLMIGPINGWEDGQKQMVGTVSVASKRQGVFLPWHTSPLKVFADHLGAVYPLFIARLNNSRRVPAASSLNGPHLNLTGRRNRTK